MDQIKAIEGKTITAIEKTDDEIKFATSTGEVYRMYHEQDCCESVSIDEVVGDLDDLIGSPIVRAEERCGEPPESVLADRAKAKADATAKGDYYWDEESETWTFYELATNKGSVTIRWHGSSNGYYSESVSFELINAD